MKRILAYGLIGATILASQSSIFAAEPVASPLANPSVESSQVSVEQMQEILDYRVELVCKALNKNIDEVSKQEILEAIHQL
ncbi:MAG: hypothetical protein ACRC1P_00625 [Cellulosilyticaceae bacterium]